MLVLCEPLALLHWVTLHNFHVKELWMTQSAGGRHCSFQPIIQMEGAIQVGSLQVSFIFFLSSCSPGQICRASRGSHLSLTSHGGRIVISCHDSASWKKDELSCSPKAAPHKVGGVEVQRVLSRRKWWSVEGFYAWEVFCQNIQSPLRVQTEPVFVTMRGKCLRCVGSLNHWFDKMSL